ncbi:MAG: hypothetical protein U5K84_11205 [Alkalibacterium sp.]|nr:hypothetical protein [Alkalibacterium sp.]
MGDDQYAAESFRHSPLDWHYNLIGMVPAYFNYSWERSDHFFCSEFIATLLQVAGILSPYDRPNLMHPRDVIEAVHPICVYDGPLQQYPKLIHQISEPIRVTQALPETDPFSLSAIQSLTTSKSS